LLLRHEDGKKMDAADFVRSANLAVGAALGT
jgi:hypothetical protein